MTHTYTFVVIAVSVCFARGCDVLARVEAGLACGVRRWTEDGGVYASFRGVPYAKQPLGELRFQELQPAEPWEGVFDATNEGPVCPQIDKFFGSLMKPQSMSESCIHANIHVPLEALPDIEKGNDASERGRPVLVYIHGGGFLSGSGDADIYGPEFIASQNSTIVITFNYRLNVFGFMSLNTSSVPGNNGLRDTIALLRWVKRNARSFGGDPDNVTLMGQSAGSVSVNLLTLSPAATGLFNRAVLMSGTAIPTWYTTSAAHAKKVARMLTDGLGINSTDPDELHSRLIALPLATIMDAYSVVQSQAGFAAFAPVVESRMDGVTTIIDDDTEVLLKKGRGRDIPFIIGFDTFECISLLGRLSELNITTVVESYPGALLPLSLVHSYDSSKVEKLGKRVKERYIKGSVTLDQYLPCCSDGYFAYPALRLAKIRGKLGAPTYLYQFSYEGVYNILKETFGLSYNGTAHAEDTMYVFRVNSVLTPAVRYNNQPDDLMRKWFTTVITNFTLCGDPTCGSATSEWPPVEPGPLKYQDIRTPYVYSYRSLTKDQDSMVDFFDSMWPTSL